MGDRPKSLLGGRIRLIEPIGRGGMGEVWIARNEATLAEVAVKTLQRVERSPVHDERFRREARLAATVTHRNVVRIFDLIDEPDGTLGLVMELLRGGTLEACLQERAVLSSIEAVAVAIPILSALHHVHQKGIVHRDVKPGNVFFAVEPDGHVIPKILDFGIAKLPAASSALTTDGSVLGTPHYMSPEQIRGHEIDGRSDMFSLAIVLHEMLTGTRVFQREAAASSLAAVLEHEVDPDPRIEPRLWLALSRALAKRPYERYATCAEFADALRAAMNTADEDLSSPLQGLRPRGDLVPRTTAAALDVPASTERPRSRRAATTAMVAASAAAFAVLATLAVVRTRATVDAASPIASGAPSQTPPPASSPPVTPAPSNAVAAIADGGVSEPRAAGLPADRNDGRSTARTAPSAAASSRKKRNVATTPGF